MLSEQQKITYLQDFAIAILNDYELKSLPEIQELAIKHQVLVETIKKEPCSDVCACDQEIGEFPITCVVTNFE